MKSFVVLALAVGLVAGADLFRGKPDRDDDWKSFKNRHGKKYDSAGEEAARRKRWEDNRDIIEKHNQEADQGKHMYKLGENHMSDWTDEEKGRLTKAIIPKNETRSVVIDFDASDRQLPSSIDWRYDYCMAPVKNQGSCGSCWAFASNTPLEFKLCKRNGILRTLSEQQLVDCTLDANYGCNGGWYTKAWKYIITAPGQACSPSYPYTATVGTCRYNSGMSVGTTVSPGFAYVADNEAAMRAAVVQGPIAVVLMVQGNFGSYKSGIYSEPNCPTDKWTINHAVVLVGYGNENGVNYWLIRNSWSTWWGDQGYMKIQRGVNMCNIESYWNAYPTV